MPSEFTLVRAELVQVRERLCPLDEEAVERLAESIRINGVQNAIRVTRDLVLVSGNHRLEACRRVGLERIPVFWFDGTPDEALLAECDENLIRRELTALQRNKHIALRVELVERMMKSRESDAAPLSHRDNGLEEQQLGTPDEETAVQRTARELGLPDQKVYRAVQSTRDVTAELGVLIEGTDIENSQRELLAIATIPENRRIEIVTRALEEGKTVQSVLAEEKSSKPIPERRGAGVRSFASEAVEDAPSAPKERVVGYRPFVTGDEERETPTPAVGYRPFTKEEAEGISVSEPEPDAPPLDPTPEVTLKRTDGVRVMLARKALHSLCDGCKATMKEALK